MPFTIRHRLAASLAVASIASLAGATGALAATPPPLASVQAGPTAVQAGPITTEIGADSQVSQVGVQADAQLAAIQSRLSTTQRQLKATGTRVRGTARRKVRALRARARSLKRQAARRVARIQQQATATASGVWALVNGAGVVLEQSGGIQVTHVGTGTYSVSFAGSGSGCLSGDSDVHVTGPSGPVDGGFFIAANC